MFQSTRSSVDREYGGVTLPPGLERSTIAPGKLREATTISTSTMQEFSTVERLQDARIEGFCTAVDPEKSHIGQPSTPKSSHIQQGQVTSGPYVEPRSSNKRSRQGYGNIGSPLRKTTDTLNRSVQDQSGHIFPKSGSGNRVSSGSLDQRPLQSLSQVLKTIPSPTVRGEAPWNASVWDKYRLNKPQTTYTHQSDRDSTINISRNASNDNDGLYDHRKRPQRTQALSDPSKDLSDDEEGRQDPQLETLAVRLRREQANNENSLGGTDLMKKHAFHRRVQGDWIQRSDAMARYAKLMGNDQ